jgi:A/G-specific adenine glycosylase
MIKSIHMMLWTRLLCWYDKHGRDLPWRHTRDPYRILVSEIMLQQTQVSRGLIFYERWLAVFPDFPTLAKASNADVIRMWSGLGYNRRALALRDVAKQVVEGGTPSTAQEWLALKGIGPYTSAAICAFAFKQRIIPIDTNIRRVLGRLLFGVTYPQPNVDDNIRRAINKILPKRGRYYDVPQALFDLATLVCTKTPSCATCPLRATCPASAKFLSGRVRIPKQSIKKSIESRHRDKPYPDRIYRGRILALVTKTKHVTIRTVGATIDPSYDPTLDHSWLLAMIARLTKDGLISRTKNAITLPE